MAQPRLQIHMWVWLFVHIKKLILYQFIVQERGEDFGQLARKEGRWFMWREKGWDCWDFECAQYEVYIYPPI